MRVSGECGLCGLPFLASLIFARVSGERGFPLSISLICALCSGVNGFCGLPLRASLIFARVSGECCLRVGPLLLHLSVRGVQEKVSFLCLLQRSLLSFRENAVCLFSLHLFVRGARG